MTYNQKFFDYDLNTKLAGKVDKLILWQGHTLDFLIKYLVSTNNENQIKHCECFLQLLAKIRFNIESINHLLPFLYSDYRYKTSINVLYRTIVDDIINGYYLFGTIALEDAQQNALKNELNILHKEFLMSSIKGINSEREFEKFLNELRNEEPSEDINVKEEFCKANPDLLNGDSWKKNSEIRNSTDSFFINLFNQNDGRPNSFISETKKIEFIAARGMKTHSNIFALFKYLSQYQHFSPAVHNLLNSHIEYDIVIYQRCLGEVLIMLSQFLQFIEIKDKDFIKGEWESLANNVFNSFEG